MKILLLILSVFLLSCKSSPEKKVIPELSNLHPNSELVSFETEDKVLIIGDLIAIDKANPTILLFHQGGSNSRAEYRPIVSSLIEEGFNILAIDQRQGGQIYGSYNRTVARLENSYSYCEAYADLEASLDYILNSEFTGEIFAWGSSYSGSLAVRLGSEYPNELSGVLAFSPASGGPMAECKADLYLDELEIPLIVLRPSRELQIESSKAQFELVHEKGFEVYEAEIGTHGSSMLVEERAEGDIDKNWEVVIKFLKN